MGGLTFVIVVAVLLWSASRQKKLEKRLDQVSEQLEFALRDIARLQGGKLSSSSSDVDSHELAPTTEDQASASTRTSTEIDPEDALSSALEIPDSENQERQIDNEISENPQGPWVRTAQQTSSGRSVEETLTSQWLIWVGALAVALSAVFLFRYAVEQGWLTPLTRVIMGLILGGLLLSAGEWATRHPVAAVRRAVNPDYVPPALTGSGLFAIFTSLFAAQAVFGLLSATMGFVALGLVAYSALGLSLRQGPFVAILGLLGGYLVPALIDTPAPQAIPLFAYLFVLSAGCLLVMVWRKWWWFSYLTLLGALTWPILWLLETWQIGDQGILESYLIGLAVLFALLSTNLPIRSPKMPIWRWFFEMLADVSGLGFTMSGLLLLLLANAAGFNAAAFVFVGIYGAAALLLATRRESLESLTLASAAIALLALLLWPEPSSVTQVTAAQDLPERGFGPFLVPPEFRIYSHALWAFAGLFGLGAFLGMRWGRSPALWAGISSLMPLLFFMIGYWRMGKLETDLSWALVAAGLAVLATFATTITMSTKRDGDENLLAAALFAASATAALTLSFTCLLREAWLTVALSCEILALAWIWSKVQLHQLRQIAAGVTLIVIARFVFNPMILDYDGQVFVVFGWVLYGYGIPAVATFLAAGIFARKQTDAVTTLCEVAAAGFAFLMVALQLRLWTAGSIAGAPYQLYDQATQSIWWITSAGLLAGEAKRQRRQWTGAAGFGLLLLSLVAVVVLHIISLSPVISGEPVGKLPVLNLLALAYLVPAVLFMVVGRSQRFLLAEGMRQLLELASGLLVFVYITLETRRAFWGTYIALTRSSEPTNAEFYAYSAIWILFALCLLFIGIIRTSVPLRYASLVVLMVTVAKVFLFDMSDLTGLFRVASFLGLGLTLIGIGRVYQLFVFRPEAPVSSNGDTSPNT